MKPKKIRYALDEQEIIGKHFGRLRYLLRDEEGAERQNFDSQVRQRNPEDRERGGRALLRLVLSDFRYNPSGQRLVSFQLANGRWLPRYGIQVGDVVTLSGQMQESERPTGTVYEKEKRHITIAFNRHLPSWVGKSSVYHLNLTENKTTYERMFEALREVENAKHSAVARLRDIALGLRTPQFRDPVRISDLSFFNENLNDLQKQAVARSLEAEEVLLLHGPPGTGKTSVLVEMIRQARSRNETVLVTAPSNAACDYLLHCLVTCGIAVTRLGNPARITEELRSHTLGYKMADHDYARLIQEHEARLDQIDRQRERRQDRRVLSREEERALRDEIRNLRQEIRNLRAEIFHQVWNSSDVVVVTHTNAGDPAIKTKVFDWVIVDEATQASEPATWIPVSRAGRVVFAGDHYQLPPTVHSPKTGKGSLRYTLFERLHEVLPDTSKVRLEKQYRMHETIMNFSSQEFYEGQLSAHDSVKQHVLADLPGVKADESTRAPLIFLDTAGLGYEEEREPGSESRFNPEEAKLVEKEYRNLVASGVPPRGIAIISPYSAQVKLLARVLMPDEWETEKGNAPEIDSIDAFQGREKEAVIVSLVRSNLTGDIGFLGDTRRMNVAMTRARRKLIVIGDSATISTLPFYEDFIRYVEKHHAYRSAWEYVQ